MEWGEPIRLTGKDIKPSERELIRPALETEVYREWARKQFEKLDELLKPWCDSCIHSKADKEQRVEECGPCLQDCDRCPKRDKVLEKQEEEEAREPDDSQLEMGFDPYLGCYTDDC